MASFLCPQKNLKMMLLGMNETELSISGSEFK